mmetsp:Transcript_40326/g.90425  ORF Transcript_40326/g.90425 Transcript_40326/m.90425 type:complete len:105 (-) Transcript_40326:23-337(-)
MRSWTCAMRMMLAPGKKEKRESPRLSSLAKAWIGNFSQTRSTQSSKSYPDCLASDQTISGSTVFQQSVQYVATLGLQRVALRRAGDMCQGNMCLLSPSMQHNSS